jgi:hypothetical protein
MYELAQTLGQPLSVVLEMTVDEFHHWYTFLRLKLEMAKGKKHGRKHNNGKNSGEG